MRGLIAELGSPHPIDASVPAIIQGSELAGQLMMVMDSTLAPIFSTLDCLPAYFDSRLAPEDFLEWLSMWVGVTLDETWPIERRRKLVASAVDLHGARGTRRALEAVVALYTGGEVTVVEGGAVSWSRSPGGPIPGRARLEMTVKVVVADPSRLSMDRLDAIVAANKPAHLAHRIEVVAG